MVEMQIWCVLLRFSRFRRFSPHRLAGSWKICIKCPRQILQQSHAGQSWKRQKSGLIFFLLLKKTGAITMLSRVQGKNFFFSSSKPRPTFRVQRHPSRKGVNKWREQADANWNCLLVHFNYSSWCFPLQLCGREETTWKAIFFFAKPPFLGGFELGLSEMKIAV